jgi:zinc transport system ATP-binding protein
MKTKNTLLKAKDVSYKVDKQLILNNVSIEIKKQDFITIIGPNGAGKTSLLKILLGITKPTKGNVDKQKNLKIGYLPQKIHIDNSIPISVRYFLKLNKNIDENKLEEVIKETQINKIADKQIHQLSGGEKQRLLLANALINDPDLLILDEPDQNLDISGQLQFYDMLNGIYKKRKMAILLVSHDLHMVMSSTKQVICLFHHICCSGKPETISKNPEFTSIFGKDMSKLMSVYNHYHNHSHG